MIYEWSVNEIRPGAMEGTHEMFKDLVVKLFETYGAKVIGYWTTHIGPSNLLYYMLAFRDMQHREEFWKNLRLDPARDTAKANNIKEGTYPHIVKTYSTILKPTDYSPSQ